MTDSKAREAFEAWEKSRGGNLTRHESGLYANSAMQGRWTVYQAARRAALEEAALACEGMCDLKEAAKAQKAADEAISRDDKDDMLHRLRHCSTVSLFNGALERAARAIRALADERPATSPVAGALPLRYKPNEDCS